LILRDGTEIELRPIRPDDKAALARGFEQLSPESRYRRFLTPMNALSARLLRYLTEVDHHSHEAIVAESAKKHEPIGVARYVRLEDDPTAAEVAVAVVDEWQGKGAGTELLARLEERALEEGIERFVATCLATNSEVLELLGEIGPTRTVGSANGTVDIEIALPTTREPEGPLRTLLRRAAAGALRVKAPWAQSEA